MPVSEFSIVRASQLTIPNKDWTHYRSGLKLSCTDNTAGVTISVVSQGRPITWDLTYISSSNVKFLTKDLIVGLKVFEGNNLKKRLQITFESEGNYNLFVNKISQWLGIRIGQSLHSSQNDSTLDLTHPRSVAFTTQETQDEFSQDLSQCLTLTSNVFSQNIYQGVVDDSQDTLTSMSQCKIPTTHAHSFSNTHANSNEPRLSYPTHFDSLSLLLGAAQNIGDASFSNPDTSAISQSTSIMQPCQDPISSYEAPPRATENLMSVLKDIPFGNSNIPKRKKSYRNRKKEREVETVEKALKSALHDILHNRKDLYDDLSDEQLALKVAKKLKSKSFSRLLKRIENLLPELRSE